MGIAALESGTVPHPHPIDEGKCDPALVYNSDTVARPIIQLRLETGDTDPVPSAIRVRLSWDGGAPQAPGPGGTFSVGSIGSPAVRKAREVRVGSLRTIELWSNPTLLVLAVLLLGAEWALRRRAGHG